jgi:hypothetical protein
MEKFFQNTTKKKQVKLQTKGTGKKFKLVPLQEMFVKL